MTSDTFLPLWVSPSALAAAVAPHAFTIWLLGLLAAAGLGAATLWWARRWHVPHEHLQGRGLPLAAAHLALAALLWLVAAGLFTQVAAQVVAGRGIVAFDTALHAALAQGVPVALLHWALVPTWLGNPPTVVVLTLGVTGFLLWRRQRVLALGWVAAVAGNALLNKALKHGIERARPLHEHGVLLETGFSFPSGHASGTLATYGMLAYLVVRLAPRAWHLPAVLLAAALAWSGAFSRVLLQVHYASDVLVGLCNGAAWLALCILSVELVRHRAPGLHRRG